MRLSVAILEALSAPILVLDKSLRAVFANPAFCRAMAIPQETVTDLPLGELLVEATDPPVLAELLEQVLLEDRILNGVEIPCILPGETPNTLRIHAQRVNEGKQRLVLVELRDVTTERESERDARQMNDGLQQQGIDLQSINAELEAFTHSVSHDLRTPLRFTNKIAHLLLKEHALLLDAPAIAKIHMILDSTEEMARLIEDLLAFSQVNRQPIRRRPVEMQRLAEEAANSLRDEFAGRNVVLTIAALPPALGDRGLLKQVFLNLLTNALKFTRIREQPEIELGWTPSEAGSQVIYFIRDNGTGFKPDSAEIIFAPFRRLPQAQPVEGSGIGLALVRRIVERHGGAIWAEAAPDKGATFYFTLSGPAPPAAKEGLTQ